MGNKGAAGKASSKDRAARRRAAGASASRTLDRTARGASVPPVASLPPLRPNRKLLIATSIALALWVAFLLVLYFKSVYPAHR